MNVEILAIATAFLLGLGARQVGLPPLVGYLIAGFLLNALGMEISKGLEAFSQMGITLLLFSIGLKLRPGSLLMPQIWGVASLHLSAIVLIAATGILFAGLVGLPYFTELDLPAVLLIAFALSFSSTVFAVKVLEENGDMSALYGRIAIGILIMQDIAAVIFLAMSAGKLPSPWALLLLALILLRPLLHKLLEKSGHGELLILFGLCLALGGAGVFELAGVKGDLGALILGMLLASQTKSSELARQLLGFKDLFLVGFFLTIGLSGGLSLESVAIALLLLPLIFFKTWLFFRLLAGFRLRTRTAFLSSLSLANYSEFGLIVIAVGATSSWISNDWLTILAIALSISFIAVAPLNMASHSLYLRYRTRLLRFQSERRIAEEQTIEPGDAAVLILGMGRVGTGAFDSLRNRLGDVMIGIDQEPETIKEHIDAGRRVILGSATDPDFWRRVNMDYDKLKLMMLTMPSQHENLTVATQMRELGYKGCIAAIAKYPDEVVALQQAGVDYAVNLYAEAGTGFADDVWAELSPVFR
jgi:predicted Kef-type K+ transport protein